MIISRATVFFALLQVIGGAGNPPVEEEGIQPQQGGFGGGQLQNQMGDMFIEEQNIPVDQHVFRIPGQPFRANQPQHGGGNQPPQQGGRGFQLLDDENSDEEVPFEHLNENPEQFQVDLDYPRNRNEQPYGGQHGGHGRPFLDVDGLGYQPPPPRNQPPPPPPPGNQPPPPPPPGNQPPPPPPPGNQPPPQNPPHTSTFHITMNGNVSNVVADNQPNACTADDFLNIAPNPRLCLNSRIVDTVIKRLNNPALGEPHGKLLLHYYSDLHNTNYVHFFASPKGLEKLGKLVKDDNIGIFNYQTILPYIARYVSPGVLANVGGFIGMLQHFPRRDLIETLNNMAATSSGRAYNWVRENGAAILALITPQNRLHITDFNPNVLKAIITEADNCGGLNYGILTDILKNDSHAKVFTNVECFNRIPNIGNYQCDVSIRNLDKRLIQKECPLTQGACYNYMLEDQIAELDKDTEDRPCQHYPIATASQYNGRKMTPRCFAGALASLQNEITIPLSAWETLPTNILSAIDNSHLDRFSEETWQNMPADFKAPLFTKPEECEKINGRVLRYHANVHVPTDCFLKMNSRNQADAIVNAKLDNNALAKVDASMARDWRHDSAAGELTQLEVLNAALHRENAAALISELGKSSEGEHVCSLINEFDTLKKCIAIQLFGSKECYDSMERILNDVNISQFKELASRARAKINKDKLLEALDDSKYRDIDPDTFKIFQRDTAICKIMKAAQFGHLPEETRKQVNETCIAQLSCLGDMTRSYLEPVTPEVFAKLDVNTVSQIPLDAMTQEQFGRASSEVSDQSLHHATKWDKALVSQLTRGHMPHIHKSAWKAAPGDAYGGLTANTFSAIPPENMVDMTVDQLGNVPEDARGTLTNEQAQSIAKNSGGDVAPLFTKASESVQAILRQRGVAKPATNKPAANKPATKKDDAR